MRSTAKENQIHKKINKLEERWFWWGKKNRNLVQLLKNEKYENKNFDFPFISQ